MFIHNFRLKTFIQSVICTLYEIKDFGAIHPKRELQKIATRDTCEYILASCGNAVPLDTAIDVLQMALDEITLQGPVLEFGVYKGSTINFIAKKLPARKVYGFDSFEGLPEKWSGNASMFDARGRLPGVKSNVKLIRGFFDQSLASWVEENPEPAALIHIDCDIYSSTKSIFDNVLSLVKSGTIIVFDEYFGYHGWREHEFRAFKEFVSENGIRYEYLCFARIQCAIRIL
jgi:predicted O-methyltransferase YrrM